MSKQLIIISDMEGATGIFDHNASAKVHKSELWWSYGRECITSDVLAVCDAANEFGIDEILIYDGHYAGEALPNIITEKLPRNAKLFDTEDRCFDWRRIRGQAVQNPFGLITVGQHARYGEEFAYFPHTIQSPPIKKLILNGIHIAEIGQAVLSFQGVKYLANIGCKASMREAIELCSTVETIPVKDKQNGWEPSKDETYGIIKRRVLSALSNQEHANIVQINEPYEFSMELMEGFIYDHAKRISWKGHFNNNIAYWESPSIEIGLEIFNHVRECITNKRNLL